MSLLSSNPNIASKINELWNKFWSGGIANPLTAIEQITYLLFMKKLDENDLNEASKAVFNEQEYVSPLFSGKFYLREEDEKEQKNGIDKHQLRWSEFKQLTAEEMLALINTWVFPFLKRLNPSDSPFARHMANAVFIIPKPSLLVEAVNVIDAIFKEMEQDAQEKGQDFQDIQGDVYEMLLSEIASAGKNGQFRTPRHIIKLLVELVAPKATDTIADPACGTGGFLVGAYQYIVTQLNQANPDQTPDEDGFVRNSRSVLLTEANKEALGNQLHGYDIDQTMVRLGLMNLMMHGIALPQIDYKDTLSKHYHEKAQYNVVLANPPFTGNIDKGDIHEDFSLKTTKSELLFIERIFNMLRMGGTAGVIIPQGVLFGSSRAFVAARKLMIEEAELKAVVTMPSGVFKPYAGVSTAILIFTKGGATENVWFYDMEADGYTLDDKRSKQEGYGDLQDIVQKYQNRDPKAAQERKKHFFVPKAEIVAENYDLSLSRYKEEVFEEIEYEKPEVILEKLLGKDGKSGLEAEIMNGLRELKGML